jgi:hypothetical protein
MKILLFNIKNIIVCCVYIYIFIYLYDALKSISSGAQYVDPAE